MIETKTPHILKNVKISFLAVLLTKLYVLMIDLTNQLFFIEKKNAVNKFFEAIFEEHDYCKKVTKKRFNQSLVMSVEDERGFQSSNKFCICNRLFTDEDKNIRYHDNIAGEYRDSTHSNCNFNLKLTKKFCNISCFKTLWCSLNYARNK